MSDRSPRLDDFLSRGLLSPEDLDAHVRLPAESRKSAQDADRAENLPERIGRYQLLEEVGEGGAARVYLCEDLNLHRPVALKLLKSADPTHIARFRREALIVAGMDHPNIVRVYESGQNQGRAFLTMQYIKGKPISHVSMTLEETLKAIQKVANALHYAHTREVLHRDVKPANILVDDKGGVFLADFGLCRETHSGTLSATGAVLGTPAYMSPEQAKGEPKSVGPLSDVYSLGATLYELVTGAPPFEGATPFEILEKVTRGEIASARRKNPKVTRDVDLIIQKAMALQPERRYASAQAFAEDIGRTLAGEPIHATPPTLTQSLYRVARKHSLTMTLTAGFLIGGLVILVSQMGAAKPVAATLPVREHFIFRDSLGKGWDNWSWSSNVSFDHAEHVGEGTRAIHLHVRNPFGAFQVAVGKDDGKLLINDYDAVEFMVHGGGTGRTIYVQLYADCETETEDKPIVKMINVGTIPAEGWQRIRVPMREINPEGVTARRLAIITDKIGDLYLDEIRLVSQ